MKNIEDLNKHLCESFEKLIEGKISPAQSIAITRQAEALLKSVRTEVIGAELQGRIAKLNFLKE